MSATRGHAHYAGLLPVELSDEPLRVSPISLENDWFQNGPSLRKKALRALSFLIAFCTGVAGAFAWWSYGDAARQMIESPYRQLSWLAPRGAMPAQKTPDMVALDAVLRDLNAMRQSVDRIAFSQEQILRSIEQIAASIAAGRDLPRSSDETGITTAQAPAADASRITESRADGAALQPAPRVDIKPSEVRLPPTLSERGKQLSAASGHEASCFASASAVLQNYPGGLPSWTLRAPGHEGTMCWHAAARPRGSDHRSEIIQSKEMVRTTANELSPPPAAYTRPPE
jgi:hypothetical protein